MQACVQACARVRLRRAPRRHAGMRAGLALRTRAGHACRPVRARLRRAPIPQACVRACVCARVSLRRAARTDAHEEEEDEEDVHDGQQRQGQRRHDLAQRLHLEHSMVSFVFIFCMYSSFISTSCNIYTAVIYMHMYVYNTPRLLSCASSPAATRAARLEPGIMLHRITSHLMLHQTTSHHVSCYLISYHIIYFDV